MSAGNRGDRTWSKTARERISVGDSVPKICVYCGSSSGNRAVYQSAAESLADELTKRGFDLVYGGSDRGIMGVLANAVLQRGGQVQGVIPTALYDKEIAHQSLTELHVVESMHERKRMMAELSDGFVALPGGFGTLEEIVEIVTWGQLRFHDKPCGLLNVGGYFDHLLAYLDHCEAEGFLKPLNRQVMLSAPTATELLDRFAAYRAPTIEKWAQPGLTKQ